MAKEMKLVDVVKLCPHSKRSLERWVASYKKYGEEGFEPKLTRPKTNPRETPIRIKEKIIALRKDNKDCALKMSWGLADEGIKIHYQTIKKIIRSLKMRGSRESIELEKLTLIGAELPGKKVTWWKLMLNSCLKL